MKLFIQIPAHYFGQYVLQILYAFVLRTSGLRRGEQPTQIAKHQRTHSDSECSGSKTPRHDELAGVSQTIHLEQWFF